MVWHGWKLTPSVLAQGVNSGRSHRRFRSGGLSVKRAAPCASRGSLVLYGRSRKQFMENKSTQPEPATFNTRKYQYESDKLLEETDAVAVAVIVVPQKGRGDYSYSTTDPDANRLVTILLRQAAKHLESKTIEREMAEKYRHETTPSAVPDTAAASPASGSASSTPSPAPAPESRSSRP